MHKIVQFSLSLILLVVMSNAKGQNQVEELPFREIKEYPESYTAGNVAARLIDGLGFRFYWSTEGLTDKDLAYKPTDESRTISETVDHIYGMTIMVLNTMDSSKNESNQELDFTAKRKIVLKSLEKVSNILATSSAEDLETYTIKFSSGAELPFWNLINGPISDCLWHCGQIVSLRRASGNPFNANVSLMTGKVR